MKIYNIVSSWEPALRISETFPLRSLKVNLLNAFFFSIKNIKDKYWDGKINGALKNVKIKTYCAWDTLKRDVILGIIEKAFR